MLSGTPLLKNYPSQPSGSECLDPMDTQPGAICEPHAKWGSIFSVGKGVES